MLFKIIDSDFLIDLGRCDTRLFGLLKVKKKIAPHLKNFRRIKKYLEKLRGPRKISVLIPKGGHYYNNLNIFLPS